MKRIAIILGLTTAAFAQQPDIQQAKLPHGIYYRSREKQIRLTFVRQSGIHIKHGFAAAVGVLPSGTVDFPGASSPVLIEDHRPAFAVNLDESQADDVRSLSIIRVVAKKDHREVTMLHGGFLSTSAGAAGKDLIETTLTSTADDTYTLAPKADLQSGEYMIFFNGAHKGGGYDFTVK